MRCANCGCDIQVAHLYCPSCGCKSGIGDAPGRPEMASSQAVKPAAHFGRTRMKWWGMLPSVAKPSDLHEGYEWLKHELMISVFADHLTVTPGGQSRSAAADFATSGAIPLLTLVAGTVRSAKDSVSNAATTPSDEDLEQSFMCHQLMWGETQKAQVWEYRQRSFFGIKTPSMLALRCELNAAIGRVQFLVPLVKSQDTLIQDPIKAIGCPVVVKMADIREKDMLGVFNDAMRRFYAEEWSPHPFLHSRPE